VARLAQASTVAELQKIWAELTAGVKLQFVA
jgi:hypothetical protein